MSSPLSPVIASIFMEYFEEIVLGLQCPIPTPCWKGCVDDFISIVKNEQVDTFFNHLNSVDFHIKFPMEAPGNYSSGSFLDAKCSPNSDYTKCIHTSVKRKSVHTDHYLNWNSNHPISAKKEVIHALIYRVKNVCSITEFLARESNYLHGGLLKTTTQIGSLRN